MAVCPVNIHLLQPYLVYAHWHTHTHTHSQKRPNIVVIFASISATDRSYTVVSCPCDRRWIFCSPNTHHISGGVMPCWRPVSLTVPVSASGGQRAPWHALQGGVAMTRGNLHSSHVQALVPLCKEPHRVTLCPRKDTFAVLQQPSHLHCLQEKRKYKKRRAWGAVSRAKTATSWDIRRGFQHCFSTEACRPHPCDHASSPASVCVEPGVAEPSECLS